MFLLEKGTRSQEHITSIELDLADAIEADHQVALQLSHGLEGGHGVCLVTVLIASGVEHLSR